ncbi:MAG: DUF354 domain-containing protein [Bacteroidota bacterium]|nr:DUF354 domain-containing protein [Bacteroidota bacterium]
MNILMDIAHPAHVHLIRNTYFELTKKGHKVYVTVKEIPSAIFLLEKFNIPYIYLGDKKDSITGKALFQLIYNLKVWWLVVSKNIELGFGTSITIAHISRISKMHAIILDDDDDAVEPLFVKYGHPYADIVLSPACAIRSTKKMIPYAGYHELAYLHPNRFAPDPSVLKEIGVKEGETYFILRFNAFKAHHDVGVVGLSIENKRKLIAYLEKKGKVFITTERNIDEEFNKYRLLVSPEKVHSLIYYATMLIGDSQTMTSEAAVLGTPAIRCNSFVGRISYLEEEEHKYALTYGFLPTNSDAMFAKVEELLAMPDLKPVWQKRRLIMLKDKIDVTSFFVWFIENYAESAKVMKQNPDYQYRFK